MSSVSRSTMSKGGGLSRACNEGFKACSQQGIGETSPKDTDMTVEEVVAGALSGIPAEPERKSVFTYSATRLGW